jgi:hypothetical protein
MQGRAAGRRRGGGRGHALGLRRGFGVRVGDEHDERGDPGCLERGGDRELVGWGRRSAVAGHPGGRRQPGAVGAPLGVGAPVAGVSARLGVGASLAVSGGLADGALWGARAGRGARAGLGVGAGLAVGGGKRRARGGSVRRAAATPRAILAIASLPPSVPLCHVAACVLSTAPTVETPMPLPQPPHNDTRHRCVSARALVHEGRRLTPAPSGHDLGEGVAPGTGNGAVRGRAATVPVHMSPSGGSDPRTAPCC